MAAQGGKAISSLRVGSTGEPFHLTILMCSGSVSLFLHRFISSVMDCLLPTGSDMMDGRMWVNREVTLTENRELPSVSSAEGTMASSSTRSSLGGHSENSYEIDRGLDERVCEVISSDESDLGDGEIDRESSVGGGEIGCESTVEDGEIGQESAVEEEVGTDGSSLVSRMVSRRCQYWRTDRMNFLLQGVRYLYPQSSSAASVA